MALSGRATAFEEESSQHAGWATCMGDCLKCILPDESLSGAISFTFVEFDDVDRASPPELILYFQIQML